ncbi:MAG: hypothetical protein QGI64_05390, partial [Desulfobacterales bacterium]|nr:hypothetical protein [Desulfobacterales bacterium]
KISSSLKQSLKNSLDTIVHIKSKSGEIKDRGSIAKTYSLVLDEHLISFPKLSIPEKLVIIESGGMHVLRY